jgi:hypothetical protein
MVSSKMKLESYSFDCVSRWIHYAHVFSCYDLQSH